MDLKKADAYCTECNHTYHLILKQNVPLTSVSITCRLCDKKLKLKISTIKAPPESGFLLVAPRSTVAA